MISPKRQTFDLPGAGQYVYGGGGAASTPRVRTASAITFADNFSGVARNAGSEEDLTRFTPYRDRKLSESVVSLTGVLEEEELGGFLLKDAGQGEDMLSTSSRAYGRTASPMARSSSQRRISQELISRNGAVTPRATSSNSATPMRFSNSNSSGELYVASSNLISAAAAVGCQTPARQAIGRRNSARAGAPTSMRQTNRANSLYTTPVTALQAPAYDPAAQCGNDSDDYFAHVNDHGENSPSQAPRVPFPRSFSTSYAFPLDSPSARRIGRHLSRSAAQSTDSVDELSVSPNAGSAIRLASVHGRHARYTSDLQIARPNFTSSQSETSITDNRSRSRRSSEMGSFYASTLDDSSTQSNVKITRDPSFIKPSKHQLVIAEEGKSDVILQLGNCIGRGQFGSVYRALNLNTGQMVAVKRIKLVNRSEDEVTQLMHEVELLKSLVHPSVVKYEGLSRGQDVVSIVLEYVENGSLLHTLKAFGNFPEKLVASYVVKILEGLNYLHEMKVVHCDLKAANILTTKNGNVKLSDFGVSLNLKAAEDLKKNDAVGTPNWMAPEVIELKGASTSADIWSLGCTIIELLTGKPPYGDILAMSAMYRIVEDDCPPLPASISASLRDFLIQCFRKNPALRPSAAMLFEHEWLQTTWKDHKALRPQDSVPFFKRIASHDSRKGGGGGSSRRQGSTSRARQTIPLQAMEDSQDSTRKLSGTVDSVTGQMERSSSSPPSALAVRPHLLAVRACSAPDAWSAKPIKEDVGLHEPNSGQMTASTTASAVSEALFSSNRISASMSTSPPTMNSFDIAGRRGSDVTSTTSIDLLRSPQASTAIGGDKERSLVDGNGCSTDASMLDLTNSDVFFLDEQTLAANKSHAFVKSSFAKAVQCKICREAVKKHAVLCEDCGLICHASCARRAAMPCNLRAQLLLMAQNQRSSMDVSRVMSPTPSASTPPPPHTPTTLGSPPIFRFPFGNKYKRNSRAGASDLNLPASLSSSPPAHGLSTSFSEHQGGLASRAKSPPTVPVSVTATPMADSLEVNLASLESSSSAAAGNDPSANKRQRRARRISLLPSHLMRYRSPSPAPPPPPANHAPAPSVLPFVKPEMVAIQHPSPSSTPSQTVNEDRAGGGGGSGGGGGDRSNTSTVSSSFQLASPISPAFSTDKAQFPSIESRTPRAPPRQSSTHAAEPIKLQDPPRKNVTRRQRFLSTGATPLSLGSTPNLLSYLGKASVEAQSPPASANVRSNGGGGVGVPWKRGQYNVSGLRLERSEGDSNVAASAPHCNKAAAPPVTAAVSPAEKRHMRRLSTKQDCVIA